MELNFDNTFGTSRKSGFTADTPNSTAVGKKHKPGLKFQKAKDHARKLDKEKKVNDKTRTSASILAATTKDFEEFKRARLSGVKDVPEKNVTNTQPESLQDFQKSAGDFQKNRGDLKSDCRMPSSSTPGSAQVTKKSNNIWGDVISQQLISEVGVKVVGLGVENSYGVGNRGPENYITRLMRKRKADDNNEKNTDVKEESDISSDGLSDDSKNYWRKKKNIKRKTVPKPSTTTGAKNNSVGGLAASVDGNKPFSISSASSIVATGVVPGSINRPSTSIFKSNFPPFASSSAKSQYSLKKDNIQKPNNPPPPSYLRERMMAMDPNQLGHYLANKMREKNRDMIDRAVHLLGKETCIKLYFKVLKIESGGGILIKSKVRRRSRGGVFLYLIKNDKRLPQDKVELLFVEDNANRIQNEMKRSQEEKEENLRLQGMDELQIRMLTRMASSAEGPAKLEVGGKGNSFDVDKDENFSYSLDKMVHHKPGYVPQEGPVGNRREIVYDDVEMD